MLCNVAFEKEKPAKGLIHDCVAGEFDEKNVVPVPSRRLRPASIDSLFHHHSVRADGPEGSHAGVDPLTAPTPSIADNTKAAPVIDDLVRNSPFVCRFIYKWFYYAGDSSGGLVRAARGLLGDEG